MRNWCRLNSVLHQKSCFENYLRRKLSLRGKAGGSAAVREGPIWQRFCFKTATFCIGASSTVYDLKQGQWPCHAHHAAVPIVVTILADAKTNRGRGQESTVDHHMPPRNSEPKFERTHRTTAPHRGKSVIYPAKTRFAQRMFPRWSVRSSGFSKKEDER